MKKVISTILGLFVWTIVAYAQGRQNPRIEALMSIKDKGVLQDSIKALSASKNEDEVLVALSYFEATEDLQKEQELKESIKKRFPVGKMVFNEFRSRIANEKDPIVNEQNYNNLVKLFGNNNPDFNLDNSRYFVAISFLGRNKHEKVLEYMNQIQDGEFVPVAFYSAAREAIIAKDYKIGETLIRKTYEALEGDTTNDYMDEFARTMSDLLYANGKYAEGFPYAQRVYFKQSKDTTDFALQLKTTYVNYLLQLRKYKEAFPLMEELLKLGGGSDLMRAKFKDAYSAVYGTGEGAEKRLAQTNFALKEKIKADILKNAIDTPAYQFALKDLSGNTVRLGDFRGKVLVLDFWATWCGPCKASFPAMQKAVDKYQQDKDVVFLFVHTMESGDNPVKSAGDYIKSKNYRFNVLMDLKDPGTNVNPAAKGFALRGVPTKIIIDGAGQMRFSTIGHSVNEDIFLEEMDAMIQIAKNIK